ncbi:hypothetical protein WK43_32515 [Burkholderia ubonensis]|nr:hypothetical protein [Burkholderia ubonensis]KVS39392.1 hypothetical protein WK37_00955 [Burkholderia ubonensis]KVS53483.1 hypothetical protein WK38_08905 [Burkholderia ubonensis]KVS74846.1 hypothetical protein WK42_21155 [Burkholderia ubonensis]KVS77350.1 hypothetical protein WK43_32515 [Burkholderia ubonensis]KVS86477.1 hypothetical protein WK45_32300 [Burkholderia ubonensis]
MKRGLRMALSVLVAMNCTYSMAAGVLKLSSTELTLEPGKPASGLYVENAGDTPLYLNVEQHLLTNPGHVPENLVPVSDVKEPSLLVFPGQLTLAPGQKYRMGVKELAQPSQTRVWRITFRPRERILVDSGQSERELTPLFVSIGYGVVIRQRVADEK